MSEANSDRTLDFVHEAIVDRVGAAIIVIDEQGAVSLLNVGAAGCSAFPRAHISGSPSRTYSVSPRPISPTPRASWTTASLSTASMSAGSEGAGVSLSPSEGGTTSRLFVGRDHTRERNLQRDLVRSAALAELGLMAAEVAHEVNNPATYLMTNLSILRDTAAEVVDVEAAAELIEECLDGDTHHRRREADAVAGVVGFGEIGDSVIDLSTVVRDACRIAGLRVKYKADLHIHDAETVEVRGSSNDSGRDSEPGGECADALTGQSDLYRGSMSRWSPSPVLGWWSSGTTAWRPRREAREYLRGVRDIQGQQWRHRTGPGGHRPSLRNTAAPSHSKRVWVRGRCSSSSASASAALAG